jgi:3',5'-cyclic AMP phosphodiesterase CpdA
VKRYDIGKSCVRFKKKTKIFETQRTPQEFFMKKLFSLVQITDFHVGRKILFPSGERDLYDELVLSVKRIASLDPLPDLVVITGDLAHHGREEDYRRVKEVLDGLPVPYYIVVGNHDSRAGLRSVFSSHSYLRTGEDFIQYTLENYPVRIIALDTLAVGSHRGLIDAKRLAWLDRELSAQPERPTIIFLHHPPFETGMPYPDSLGLDGKEELGRIIARHPNVEAVASGHTHRDSVVRWHGTVAYVTPSSSFRYKLEFHDVDDLDPLYTPPSFRVFRWDPEVGLVSHLCYSHEYEFGLSEGVPGTPDN